MTAWLRAPGPARLAIVEIGAGQAVPTVRMTCEDLVHRYDGTLIRINPREPDVPPGHLALPMGALAALRTIDGLLGHG